MHAHLAHIGGFLEPLIFLPAFAVVGWSIVRSIRDRRNHYREDPHEHR